MKHEIKTGKAISLAILILGSGCEKPVPVDANIHQAFQLKETKS